MQEYKLFQEALKATPAGRCDLTLLDPCLLVCCARMSNKDARVGGVDKHVLTTG